MSTKPAAKGSNKAGSAPAKNVKADLKRVSGGLMSSVQKKMDDTVGGQMQKIG